MGEARTKKEASKSYLQELGLLAVEWSKLEAVVDLLCAILSFEIDKENIPRPFNQRLKFIRRKFRHAALFSISVDLFPLLDRILNLSRRRNDITHGIAVAWQEDNIAEVVAIREFNGGLYAITERHVSIEDIRSLNHEVDVIMRNLFGILERLKSIFRFLRFEDDFILLSRLDGDRG